jgi:hypothetical protein
MFRCLACHTECDIHTIDAGCYEEVWGARVWVPFLEDVSDCCHSEFEEVEDGNKDTTDD